MCIRDRRSHLLFDERSDIAQLLSVLEQRAGVDRPADAPAAGAASGSAAGSGAASSTDRPSR
eukprot:7106749-Alexandrium_andersonii.AAC.1